MEKINPDGGYRHIPVGEALCGACDHTFQLIDHPTAPSFVNKYGVRQKPRILPVHGPRNARCAGSHQAPVPWLEERHLPAWDDLTDLDKTQRLYDLALDADRAWYRRALTGPEAGR